MCCAQKSSIDGAAPEFRPGVARFIRISPTMAAPGPPRRTSHARSTSILLAHPAAVAGDRLDPAPHLRRPAVPGRHPASCCGSSQRALRVARGVGRDARDARTPVREARAARPRLGVPPPFLRGHPPPAHGPAHRHATSSPARLSSAVTLVLVARCSRSAWRSGYGDAASASPSARITAGATGSCSASPRW